MPAAAVIPAPTAYIKAAAVQKLVVKLLLGEAGPSSGVALLFLATACCLFPYSMRGAEQVNYLEQNGVFQANT